jgi:EpsI family protein
VVQVDLAYYRQQNRERKLVSSTNVLLPQGDPAWRLVEQGQVRVDVQGQPTGWLVSRLVNRQGTQADRLVWRSHWVDGGFIAPVHQVRWRLAKAQALGRGDDAAGVVLDTELDDPAAAEQRLRSLVTSGLPALQATLEAARGSRP